MATSKMTLTPQQRNVRTAFSDRAVYELDGGEGSVVWVTRGYYEVNLDSSVIAVEPDGTVSGWSVSHSWKDNGPGWQQVHAQPTHYDLAQVWMARFLAGDTPDPNCPAGRVPYALPYASLLVVRTEGRPVWHVQGVLRMMATYLSTEVHDAPPPLVVALDAIYGPDLPTEQRSPGGRRHGE